MPVIICAEDDPQLQHLIRRLLGDDGHTVLPARDGEFALQASRQHPGAVDLLLTDIEMPRMNGLELCEKIQAERPATKILIMSGDLSGPERLLWNGLPFLPKPFRPADLRASIHRLLSPVALTL
jgi:CheY-like chemotaxis protein